MTQHSKQTDRQTDRQADIDRRMDGKTEGAQEAGKRMSSSRSDVEEVVTGLIHYGAQYVYSGKEDMVDFMSCTYF